ncbi:MAG: AhpC/TSA family protein [Pedobacter sp.]|nr:MAG: AhpC/TSA family protein [Pedobacter sp.]
MKLKHIKTIIALLISPLALLSQDANFGVSGKVSPKYNGKYVKLFYTNGAAKVADSVSVSKGTFQFKGNIDAPTVGKLSFGTEDMGDRIDIFLSEGTVRVAAKDSITHATVGGTKLAETHEKLAKRLRPGDKKFFDGFNTFKMMPEGEAKKAYIAKLMTGLDEYTLHKRETINKFAVENPTSYVSLYYLDKIAPGSLANYETTYPYYDKLSKDLKETVIGKKLGDRLMASKGKLTGQGYKDFTSTTPEGNQLTLKEVIGKNKYTLVDFWASWCGPCRKENPNVVKTFNAFKDKGFTVLSVSLDENAEKWKAAIEKDGMPWYHVSSLKGWKEPAAALYEVRAIPQNVLVDDKGKVVATNLRAEALYNKVADLLK